MRDIRFTAGVAFFIPVTLLSAAITAERKKHNSYPRADDQVFRLRRINFDLAPNPINELVQAVLVARHSPHCVDRRFIVTHIAGALRQELE